MTTQQYNQEVRSWTSGTRRKVRNKILSLVLSVGPAYENFKTDTKAYQGEVNRIGFSFPYYMVFVHKGAGRGYGGSGFLKGRRLVNEFTRKDGSKGVTNPASIGRMGTGRRVAKPWFNPVLQESLPSLEGIIVEHKGDKIIDQIQKALYNRAKID